MIKVTLIKSVSNETKTVKATVEALGLKKIGQTKTFEESPAVLGQVKKAGYLLKVEKGE
ncbi:MAG: 50S ribosomal protein L30 [Clostridia bacterium]|jgi:large subunit ribosomal protein L30|nr:50S ribosomal protein L30 [Clostridia bacterium]